MAARIAAPLELTTGQRQELTALIDATKIPDVRAAADISEPTLHELAESFLSSHFEDADDAYHALRNHQRQGGTAKCWLQPKEPS